MVIGRNYIDKDYPHSPVEYIGICEWVFSGQHKFEGIDADIQHSGMICDDGDLDKYIIEIDNKKESSVK